MTVRTAALRMLISLLLTGVALSCAAPAAPSAAPAAPARIETQVVEKVVEVEKVIKVEKVLITTPTPRTTGPTPEGGTHWANIQGAGKLVAGISTGYRPFAYHTAATALDGFDVALVREIGRRLGLAVTFKDFPPNGLPAALQLGQVDLAIGGLVPGAGSNIAFTDPYLLSQDAVVAHQSGGVGNVRTVQDLAARAVGVRRGSAQEAWASTALVAAGLVRAADLRPYDLAEQALADLRQGRVDVVILDKAAAQAMAAAGGYTIAGEGLEPQPLAIAVPAGSLQLAGELNRVLADLWRDGTAARLAAEHLGLPATEIVRPPSAPGETVAPQPPAGCLDGMAWVRDLTLDDRGMAAPPEVAAGQRIVKGWRLRNVGACAWEVGYALAFLQGASPLAELGGAPAIIAAPVPAGAEHDIYVELTAPQEPGVYQGFWQMRNGQSVPFGERVGVGISVPAPPAPPPPPTATPLPPGTFMADRTNIAAGECITLTWRFDNIREIRFAVQDRPDTLRDVMGQDSRRECPAASTVYELHLTHLDGSPEVRRIRVAVAESTPMPLSVLFTIDPPTQIRAGQCVQLAWEVRGAAELLCLLRNDVQIGAGAPLIGSIRDCPPGSGDVVYILQASCPDGVVYARREVKVAP